MMIDNDNDDNDVDSVLPYGHGGVTQAWGVLHDAHEDFLHNRRHHTFYRVSH